jgi:ankyrin repeat protein
MSDNRSVLYGLGDMGDLLTHAAVVSENASVLLFLIIDYSMNVNLPNDAHVYPLHYAVMNDDIRMVTLLVNNGAFIDCTDDCRRTPLMISCERDHDAISEFLMDRGASTIKKDSYGDTALHIAVKSKSYDCMNKLFSSERAVDVNSKNNVHDTPLHIACRMGFHSISRNLLDEEADPHLVNKFGKSPLDEANLADNNRLRNIIMRYVS